QQINMNQKLDSLVSLQLANGFSAALGYVGMDVSFVSSDVPFDGSAPVKIHYALESEASEATINIRDESGNAIYTADALTSTGKHDFTWDGTLNGGGLAEPGTYTVTIDAFDSEGSLVNSSTVVTGRVRGVETQNGSLFVLVGDRAVSIGSILNASEPETSTTTNTTTI
ncbi:MAG: flagellar hook capping family protein, partial [Alphaproteobacteria bacterium]|nr:flagellar hook capping family protein [Alphaproteobacteria bacterium]